MKRIMLARARNKLTARQVATFSEPNVYSDGGGLYLRVRPSGRSWIFIGTFRKSESTEGEVSEDNAEIENASRKPKNPHRFELGLGSALDVSLAKARERAAEIRALLVDGIDPRAQRVKVKVAEKPIVMFGKFAMELLDNIEDGFKNPKHRQQWRSTLTNHAQQLFEVPINEVSTEHILAVLKPIWLKTPETASRLRGRIERVLDAAKVKGLRTGENPARGRGHLDLLLPKRNKTAVKHHPALPFANIAEFVADLRQRPAVAARALELVILTAGRSGEVRGMTWGEVDLEAKIWTVPADRMKAGVIHEVPLSDAALKVLATVNEEGLKPSDYVFPAPRGGSLSDMALSQLLKRMGHGNVTVHGFRSTFRDWAGETTQFGREEIEMALAHTVASSVERAYRRGRALGKRRELMTAWAQYCANREDIA